MKTLVLAALWNKHGNVACWYRFLYLCDHQQEQANMQNIKNGRTGTTEQPYYCHLSSESCSLYMLAFKGYFSHRRNMWQVWSWDTFNFLKMCHSQNKRHTRKETHTCHNQTTENNPFPLWSQFYFTALIMQVSFLVHQLSLENINSSDFWYLWLTSAVYHTDPAGRYVSNY